MIAAIVLAAGESRRMGRQKLLLPYNNKTVIEHVVDQVLASVAQDIIVVTGHDGPAVAAKLFGKAVTIVENPAYKNGMLTSIRRGIRSIPNDAEAFFVVLGDQPGLTSEVLNTLVDTFHHVTQTIVIPKYDGKPGHPILVGVRYKDEILTKFDDIGLRGLIAGHPGDVFHVYVDQPAILRDIDTPEDYQREVDLLKGRMLPGG